MEAVVLESGLGLGEQVAFRWPSWTGLFTLQRLPWRQARKAGRVAAPSWLSGLGPLF